jgi:nitronate monooxygenase
MNSPEHLPTLLVSEDTTVLLAVPSLHNTTPQTQALLEARVPVLAFYFGLPDPALLAQVQAAGTYTMGTATNKQEALQLVAAGIDCVVVQGSEAGGHRGTW